MSRISALVLFSALAGCVGDKADTTCGPDSFIDADGDGQKTAIDPTMGCTISLEDCDDGNAAVYIGADEFCDEIDNDCDGEIDESPEDGGRWYPDSDRDGYGETSAKHTGCRESGDVTTGGDCNDADPEINSGATEVCDEIDNDCDGIVDVGDPTLAESDYAWEDQDGDGFGSNDYYGDSIRLCPSDPTPDGYIRDDHSDCDDADSIINPNAVEICDGVDNDCDGLVEVDSDGDGEYGASPDPDDAGCGDDCNDSDPHITPRATELCDGVDNDCDGEIDTPDAIDAMTYYLDADIDSFGSARKPQNFCYESDAATASYVLDSDDCDDNSSAINPGATEVCDTVDNDCDDKIDENAVCEDGDGTGTDLDSDGWDADSDCNDSDAATNPGAEEICDTVDNDCDGITDTDASDRGTWYADTDGDRYGDAVVQTLSCDQPEGYVADATDCNDDDGTINPGASDTAGDGIDQDCSGADVTDLTDLDGDGYQNSSGDGSDCNDSDDSVNPGAPDVDNDGKDNNCDGTVVDYLCVTPTETATPWELYLTNYTTWGDSDPDWMVEGTAIAEGTGQLCASVTLVEGEILKIQGPFNDGSFWLFGGASSGDHYSSSTTMGISMTFENASWGTGSDGYGTVPDLN